MINDDDEVVTDAQVIDRVESTGSIVVHRAAVERDDVATWRRGLRALARERGIRIAVRLVEGVTFVIYDPDFVVSRERLRATIEAMPVPEDLAPTPAAQRPGGPARTPPRRDPPRRPRRHLRVVSDERPPPTR